MGKDEEDEEDEVDDEEEEMLVVKVPEISSSSGDLRACRLSVKG